jgi:hypothetical protein
MRCVRLPSIIIDVNQNPLVGLTICEMADVDLFGGRAKSWHSHGQQEHDNRNNKLCSG